LRDDGDDMEAQQTTMGAAAGVAARWGKVRAWWQWHPDMDLEILGLLSILATYADDDGYCDPSQRTLGKRAHRCRRSINALIARAEALRPRVLVKEARTRRNGGTTSCLYRVVHEAPPEFALWFAADRGEARMNEDAHPPVRGGAHAPGTAVHTLNQPQVNQNNNPHAAPRETKRDFGGSGFGGTDGDAGPDRPVASTPPKLEPEPPRPWEDADGRLARGWEPGQEVVSEALRLYPDADIEEHTALFVSRSRSKHYRHADPNEGWLAWLIEDQRKARQRAAERAALPPSPHPWPGAIGRGQNFDRFEAWAAASVGNPA
jgi:hypothetical protein